MHPQKPKLCIVGLGYVGLPLALEFGKITETVGFDTNTQRIEELRVAHDRTLESSAKEFEAATQLSYTHDIHNIAHSDVYIVTVPTPIDSSCQPDLSFLEEASRLLGQVVSNGNVIIFESTVFPGCTEENCIPIIERVSGLQFNTDFFAGYSPERINPGDKERRLPSIIKITSGSTPDVADYVDQLYRQIITAGTHKASSIRVAEAAKVIENTQRDLNIAMVNELALIFDRMGIDTLEVLEAAGTKWNFLPFRPGLVGGHCISVDPYYLTHKAQELGYHPEVILSGRRVNGRMGQHIADTVVKTMTHRRIHVVDANILILGLTFKENCPDIRNTGVIDIISSLEGYNANIDIYDPWVNEEDAKRQLGYTLISNPQENCYDAIIIAVAHEQFITLGSKGIHALGKTNHVLYDVKHILTKDDVDARL